MPSTHATNPPAANQTAHRAALLRRAAICQFWAFVLFVPALGPVTLASNRYYLHWTAGAAAVRLAGVLLTGLLILLLGEALRRRCVTWHAPLASLAALAAVAFVFWPRVTSHPEVLFYLQATPLAAVAGAALVVAGWKFGLRAATCQRALARVSLWLSPVVPLFFAVAFSYPSFGAADRNVKPASSMGALDSAGGTPVKHNVYLFVFDGWSYRLTFDEEGRVLPHLPHLRELAAASCVFSDAHAAGCFTLNSMPRLLFQRRGRLAIRGGELGFWDGRFQPARELPNLFTAARARGMRTHMVGWLHPYGALLSGSADTCHAVSIYDALGEGAAARARQCCWDAALRLLGTSAADDLAGRFDAMSNDGLARIRQDLLRCTHALIDEPAAASPQFVVAQLPVAEAPLRFAADTPRTDRRPYAARDEAEARRQVAAIDQLVGQLLARLRAAGKYESSTIVFTSDHAWAHDPQLEWGSAPACSHVPLLVKFAGQREAAPAAAPVSADRLGRLLFLAADADGGVRCPSDLVAREKLYEPLPRNDLRHFRLVEK